MLKETVMKPGEKEMLQNLIAQCELLYQQYDNIVSICDLTPDAKNSANARADAISARAETLSILNSARADLGLPPMDGRLVSAPIVGTAQ